MGFKQLKGLPEREFDLALGFQGTDFEKLRGHSWGSQKKKRLNEGRLVGVFSVGVGGFRVLEIGHLSCWRWRGLGFGGLKVKWKLSKKRRRSKDIRKDIGNLKIIKNSLKYNENPVII